MEKIVVVGGGASGLIASIFAKNDNNEVIILERNNKIGKKLLITGNGKCNYFNEDQSLNHYYSNNKELIKEIINYNTTNEVLEFFNKIGIVPKIKNGYYYPCTNQSSTIKNALLNETENKNIKIEYEFLVKDIKKENDKFKVIGNNKEIICDKVILSTGSLSYPKTGSTGFGYDLLKEYNHTIIKPLPGLCALNINFPYLKDWHGVRVDSKLSLESNNKIIKEEIGELQLTDYGISGICTFNLSSLISRNLDNNIKQYVHINFIPTIDNFKEFLEERNNIMNNPTIYKLLEGLLNDKLLNVILKYSKVDKDIKYNELNNIDELINNIIDLKVEVKSTKSFDSSQVTIGGLSLDDINIKTMASNKVKDLYITGELLDLNGDCGGYNLTIAWITGMLAGKSIGDSND